MSKDPIGYFDSGVGGISIHKECTSLMPYENSIYLADSAHAPYGERSVENIVELCKKNTELLLDHNSKCIVVACNTATTNAITYLRHHYDVPIIGIEPAIKPAAIHSRTGAIGILATKGTLSSLLFNETSKTYANHVDIVEVQGKGLVECIEAGEPDGDHAKALLQEYLAPMLAANIDHLVLGCSHYPSLIPTLRLMLPAHVTIIDSGEAVARQTRRILTKNGLRTTQTSLGNHTFYTNKEVTLLKQFTGDSYENASSAFLEF